MPPKFIALTCMTTRPSNKDAHLGVPDMPTPRHTHEEVEAAHQEAAEKEAQELEQHEKAVAKVATIEDKQCLEDKERERARKKPQKFGSNSSK